MSRRASGMRRASSRACSARTMSRSPRRTSVAARMLADGLIRHILEATHALGVLVVHGLELRGVRVHLQEGILQRLGHVGEVGLRHELPELVVSPGALREGG